jgi:dihydroorotate dehydrogenase (NAD+) catalytic subunit
MLAGASAVGIGYAAFRNPTALPAIIDDLEDWCSERKIDHISDLIGGIRDEELETDTLKSARTGA